MRRKQLVKRVHMLIHSFFILIHWYSTSFPMPCASAIDSRRIPPANVDTIISTLGRVIQNVREIFSKRLYEYYNHKVVNLPIFLAKPVFLHALEKDSSFFLLSLFGLYRAFCVTVTAPVQHFSQQKQISRFQVSRITRMLCPTAAASTPVTRGKPRSANNKLVRALGSNCGLRICESCICQFQFESLVFQSSSKRTSSNNG